MVTVKGVNDPPSTPEIIKPSKESKSEYGTLVEFQGSCDDSDLVYGDALAFSWISNISGELGEGENLGGVSLLIGVHTITLNVQDDAGEESSVSMTVMIIETPNSDSDGDGLPNIWEREYGLDPLDPDDAAGDPDNDNVTNLEEYLAGTEPTVDDREVEDGEDGTDGTDGTNGTKGEPGQDGGW